MYVRTFVPLIVAALTLAAVSACGGGEEAASGASPEEWSADVCGALNDWKNDLEQGANELQDTAANTTSIAEGRDLIVDFLDTTVTRTDQMLSEVEAAGNPAVDNGEAIAHDFNEELAKIKPVFEDAREKAAALPDDPQAFVQGAQEIGTSMASAGGAVGAQLEATTEKFDAPELEEAFNETAACQQLD